MNKDNIITIMRDEISQLDYETDYETQELIFEEMLKAKTAGGILPLLRKHPNWDEENMCVWFKASYTREIETKQCEKFAYFLNGAVWKILETGDDEMVLNTPKNMEIIKRIDVVWNFIRKVNTQFLSADYDEDIAKLNELNPNYHLRNNMKSSKAILKICREEGWDKLGGEYTVMHNGETKKGNVFDREYSALADALNPLKVTRHTLLSLHPMDFYNMSYGTSWKSCHNIFEPGCYSSGTVSYMLDETSLVFYTLPEEYNGDEPWSQRKVTRQIFGYMGGELMQSRMYPQANDYGAETAYTETRAIVQKVIAECLDEPNLWSAPVKGKTSEGLDTINSWVELGKDATCYPDWRNGNPGSTHCVLSKLKSKADWIPMRLGAQPICVTCGERHCETDSISCCAGGTRCEYCGARVSEDDIYWCEDVQEHRCGDCCSFCEDCGEYYATENEIEVQGRNGDVYYICNDCYQDGNYYRCDRCGTTWHMDDMQYIDEEWVCPDCESELEVCEECGEVHLRSNMYRMEDVEGNDHWFCNPECYEMWIDVEEE